MLYLLIQLSPPKSAHWYRSFGVDKPKEDFEEYMQVFERLGIGVGQVVGLPHTGERDLGLCVWEEDLVEPW